MPGPLLDDLDVDLWLPTADDDEEFFRLDTSHLDDPDDVLAPAARWQPVLGQARSVRIRRGVADDLTRPVQVGTCTLTLVNSGEPTPANGIRPQVPIRVRRAGPASHTGPTPPTTPRPGDIWYDTNDGLHPRRWSVPLGPEPRRNLLPNPSFEDGTTGYYSGSATITSTSALNAAIRAGQRALSIEVQGASASNGWASATTDLPPGSAGRWVGWSVVARRSTGVESARMWVDAPGVPGSDAYLHGWDLTAAPQAEQERQTVAWQIPAGATQVRTWLRLAGTPSGGPPSDGRVHTDAWMLTIADTEAEALAAVASPYMDGDTAPPLTSWEGEPHASPSTYTPGWVEVAPDDVDSNELFTGRLSDIAVRYDLDKSTGTTTTVVTMHAVDLVQEIANTPRDGAVVEGGASWETWEARIHRYMRLTGFPYTAPVAGEVVRTSTEVYRGDGGQRDASSWGAVRSAGGRIYGVFWPGESWSAGDALLTRTLTGLQPGEVYRFTATLGRRSSDDRTPATFPTRVGLGVVGIGYATTEPLLLGSAETVTYQFTATATTHQLALVTPTGHTAPETGPQAWFMLMHPVVTHESQALPTGSDIVLASTVYESTLANHLDLACATVGARWWIDPRGVVRFTRQPDAEDSSVRFGDFRSTDPNHVSYLDLEASYDTRSLVNRITLSNKDRDPTSGLADERTFGPYEDPTLVATFGPRAATVDTNVWTAPDNPASPHHDNAARVAALYLGRSGNAMRIARVRFNARAHSALAACLDVYSPVDVAYLAHSQRSTVLAVEHDITTDRWTTTLTLDRR